jgi:flagellar hook-length control protein FliK
LASVSVVSSTDFRANLSQPQSNAPDGDDPFSLLLNSVADVKADAQRPEAPQAPDRRKGAPAKQPKLEADADRQAKKQAGDTEKPEAATQVESTAPEKSVTTNDEGDNTETDGDDAAADALLLIALGETQQQNATLPEATVDTNVSTDASATPVAALNTGAGSEIQTAPAPASALAIAVAGGAEVAATAALPVQAAKPAKVDLQLEVSTPSGVDKVMNLGLPEAAAEKILSYVRPESAAVQFKLESQIQTQPGSVNVSTGTALQGPSPLEMLNTALTKHIQLSLGADAGDQAQDGMKPLVSSNAVSPNFAMTAQVSAPVQVQTQQAVEASRAVPLDQLAVEIATRANKGERRFDIRLDPPELGRIDVRLEIDSKGNTTAKLIVERAETLDMLQRDARGLEKALQNAGLKTDSGGMQFSLQQDTQAHHGQQNHAPEMRARPDQVQAEGEIMAEVSINNATLAAQLRGGVDIRI